MDALLIVVGGMLAIAGVALLVSLWGGFIALLVLALVHFGSCKNRLFSVGERLVGLVLLAGLLAAIVRVVAKKLL
jgi:hypothetical protein